MKRASLLPSTWFCIFLILVGVIFTVYAVTLHPLQASLLGLLCGPLLILLGVAQFRKELREARETDGGSRTSATPGVARRFGQLLIWMVSLVVGVHLVGFLVAIPVFLLVFLKLHDTGWLSAILIAGITTGTIYGLFEYFLEREFYRGLLWFF